MKRLRGLRKRMRSALTTLLSRRCHQHSIHFDLIRALLTSYAELRLNSEPRRPSTLLRLLLGLDAPNIGGLSLTTPLFGCRILRGLLKICSENPNRSFNAGFRAVRHHY